VTERVPRASSVGTGRFIEGDSVPFMMIALAAVASAAPAKATRRHEAKSAPHD